MRSVLCFGDSNTHGTKALRHMGDMERFARDERWPGVMGDALGTIWQVIEEGQPGRTTVHDDPVEGSHRNGLRILPALLETHRPLNLVIVMLGTNDAKARFGLTPADIALSASRLLRLIAQSNAGPLQLPPRALLVAPVPVEETGVLAEIYGGGAEKSRALAARYREVAERMEAGFLDAGAHAQVDPLDGVHLRAGGHAALGRAMAEAVMEMMD